MTSDNRYSHGKIYKIIDNTTGVFYIGSTALKRLDQRYAAHKSRSMYQSCENSNKDAPIKGYKLYQYFTPDKLQSEDVAIILMEEVNVQNQRELTKIENEYMIYKKNKTMCYV